MLPPAATAQTSHAEAKAQVEAKDKRTHNKLKTEGIPTVTGAVAGGVAGGPAGAFTGAKVGHGVGSVVYAVKKHHDIKKIEKHGRPRRRRVVRARTERTAGGPPTSQGAPSVARAELPHTP
jgi:hypothetical protein